MSWGKKNLTPEQAKKLRELSEDRVLTLTEQWMLDRLDGATTCRYCRLPMDGPKSCPRCAPFKRPVGG